MSTGALFVGVEVFARGANISGSKESLALGHRKRDNSASAEREGVTAGE